VSDRATRSAALWATAIAVPVAVLAGILIFSHVRGQADASEAAAGPSASTPAIASTAPVAVPAPKLSPRAAQVCLAVTSQLPLSPRGVPQRKVTAGAEQNAAYGDPAITVTCGGAQPKVCTTPEDDGTKTGCLPMITRLVMMNNVCFHVDSKPAAAVFTTMDREVPVAVTVPRSYAKPAEWALEFADPIVETDRSLAKVPYGCS
jgi:hypothetical protein